MIVDDTRKRRFVDELLSWKQQHPRPFPWRSDDIGHYEMFIAEFFLSRTRPDVVEQVYDDFLTEYPDIQALATADEGDIAHLIRPLGLQNNRAAALKTIADQVDDGLPTTRDALLDLPRVGPYVANATLCFGHDIALPIVDRNVKRVYSRVFGDDWPSDEEAQYRFAKQMLPEKDARLYNLALLDFPSLVCTARDPDCESCFTSEYCEYYRQQPDIEASTTDEE